MIARLLWSWLWLHCWSAARIRRHRRWTFTSCRRRIMVARSFARTASVPSRCPFKYGCKPEGEAVCVVENGEIRNRMACCPMYTVCRACKCLKDGTYKGYCKDGVCTYRIPLGK